MNVLLIAYLFKFVSVAKQMDLGKLLDLTLKYSITVVCFYVLPYAISVASKGSFGVPQVREITALLASIKE